MKLEKAEDKGFTQITIKSQKYDKKMNWKTYFVTKGCGEIDQ